MDIVMMENYVYVMSIGMKRMIKKDALLDAKTL